MPRATPHPVLLLAARARGHDGWSERFRTAAAAVHDWPATVEAASDHGLGPLLHAHLKEVGVEVGGDALDRLRGVRVFHRRANAVRAAVLAEIVPALEAVGIGALVLKGAALAHTVYPDPGLRPMRDVDLLVPAADARRAQDLLLGLGFSVVEAHAHFSEKLHQLPAVQREQGGVMVTVEVHRSLGIARHRAGRTTYEELAPSGRDVAIGVTKARILGPLDLLFHVYRHGFAGALSSEPLRLIWAADVVSVVEAYAREIDWEAAARLYPELWSALPFFHHLTPWSDAVLAACPMTLGAAPEGVGADYVGWPRPRGELPLSRWLAETFSPSPWWLHLHYGRPAGPRGALASRARHVGQLLRRVGGW